MAPNDFECSKKTNRNDLIKAENLMFLVLMCAVNKLKELEKTLARILERAVISSSSPSHITSKDKIDSQLFATCRDEIARTNAILSSSCLSLQLPSFSQDHQLKWDFSLYIPRL